MNTVFALLGQGAQQLLDRVISHYNVDVSYCIKDTFSSQRKLIPSVVLGRTDKSNAVTQRIQRLTKQCFTVGDIFLANAPKSCSFAPNSVLNEDQIDQLMNDKGSDLLLSLEGNFNLIHWHENKQELSFATSALNSRSLFYAFLDQTLIVSSDFSLVRQLCSPVADPNSISLWLSGRPDPNLSMYSNIKQLPFGSVAKVSCELSSRSPSIKFDSFWDINPQTTLQFENEKDYQNALRRTLTNSVSKAINTSKSNVVFSQMSGGMDSTSITAIAHQLIQGNNQTLHSVSHTYRDTQSCDEMDNIQAMIDNLRLKHSHFIELDKFNDLTFCDLYPTNPQSPGMVHSPKYHQELSIIREFGGDTLLTGNGGDEMCWGHSLVYRDRLMSGDAKVIAEVARSAKQLGMPVMNTLLNVLVKPSLPDRLLNLLGKRSMFDTVFPSWLTNKAIEACEGSLKRQNPFTDNTQKAKFARYEGLFQTSTFNSMRAYQAVADEYGVRVHHPFMDKNIAKFSFAIPQHLHINSQYPKHLLRKTMDGMLPKQVCWNQTKTVFDQHFANLIRANAQEIQALLSHSALQDLGLIDNAQVLNQFDRVVKDPDGALNVDLLYAILTQSWYQSHIEH